MLGNFTYKLVFCKVEPDGTRSVLIHRGAPRGVCSRGCREKYIHGSPSSTHIQAWGGLGCREDTKERTSPRTGPGSRLVVATTALAALGKRRLWQGPELRPRL